MKKLTLTLIALLLVAMSAGAQNTLEIVWTGWGEGTENQFGAGACGGDFNNDGFSDVLIGGFGWNSNQGKDWLYVGSEDYFTEASVTFIGDSTQDAFDLDISNIQDVNGDNYDDILIPAYYCNEGGYCEIYFGDSEIDTLPDWRVQKAVIQYLETFGTSTDSLGDVNGDGWSDFIISGGHPYNGWNYMEIYHGGPDLDTIPDWRYTTETLPLFAFEVSGIGDVNGDGFGDLMAFKKAHFPYEIFPVMIFFGGSPMDTIPDLEFLPDCWNAAGVGDINDDGFNDVAICKYHAGDDIPYTSIYFGGVEMDTLADVTLSSFQGPQILVQEGFTCADVNGDGISDMLCEAGGDQLMLYLGSPWFNGSPDWLYSEFYMYFGFTITGVGDVNNDGCDDLVLGMPHWNEPFDNGKAYLFAGNPDLVDWGAPVEPGDIPRTPGWFSLKQNYPNPFNSSTTIHFELGKLSTVTMKVYDLRSNLVRQLITTQEMLPGGYNVSWTGRNSAGRPVASGMYLLELTVNPRGGGQYRDLKKMILLK